ncbi:unnamed protein product [Phaedon cochleariae]|uniref:Uncharacterized protein n=1 Tax=Phaedon cochleariae TaxID=80249 RepID=A0A9P0DSC5_PHACE|nr:unnamed protein product [Phaedon cochleariae]
MHIVTNIGSAVESSMPLGSVLPDIPSEGLEGADGQLILHAMDIVYSGAPRIVIRSSDTGVLVLANSFFYEFHRKGLWVLFGNGRARRYVKAHDVASVLGESKAVALRFFHCLTGCDTVSHFSTRGKRNAVSAWTKEDYESFFLLSHPISLPLSDDVLCGVEKFVIRMYGVKDQRIHVRHLELSSTGHFLFQERFDKAHSSCRLPGWTGMRKSSRR